MKFAKPLFWGIAIVLLADTPALGRGWRGQNLAPGRERRVDRIPRASPPHPSRQRNRRYRA